MLDPESRADNNIFRTSCSSRYIPPHQRPNSGLLPPPPYPPVPVPFVPGMLPPPPPPMMMVMPVVVMPGPYANMPPPPPPPHLPHLIPPPFCALPMPMPCVRPPPVPAILTSKPCLGSNKKNCGSDRRKPIKKTSKMIEENEEGEDLDLCQITEQYRRLMLSPHAGISTSGSHDCLSPESVLRSTSPIHSVLAFDRVLDEDDEETDSDDEDGMGHGHEDAQGEEEAEFLQFLNIVAATCGGSSGGVAHSRVEVARMDERMLDALLPPRVRDQIVTDPTSLAEALQEYLQQRSTSSRSTLLRHFEKRFQTLTGSTITTADTGLKSNAKIAAPRTTIRNSFIRTRSLVLRTLRSEELPPKYFWRICLAMAMFALHSGHHGEEALYWFEKVNQLQPFSIEPWMERAKCLKERGDLVKAAKVLRDAVQFCGPQNGMDETLLAQLIRLNEPLGEFAIIRTALASLSTLPIEKAWKMMILGAEFEGRVGQPQVGRRVFQYLSLALPRSGPLFHQAAAFEVRYGTLDSVIATIDKGLDINPQYAPLWFEAFRFYEYRAEHQPSHGPIQSDQTPWPSRDELVAALDHPHDTHHQYYHHHDRTSSWSHTSSLGDAPSSLSSSSRPQSPLTPDVLSPPPPPPPFWICPENAHHHPQALPAPATLVAENETTQALAQIRALFRRAIDCISKEQIWKVYFRWAQFEERQGCYLEARHALAFAAMYSFENVRWKVWVTGARMELLIPGREKAARKLLVKALADVPAKMQCLVWLEMAKLEEFCGKIETARLILQQALKDTEEDWKMYLELVLFEVRVNNVKNARDVLRTALKVEFVIYPSNGRLWAMLIQLTGNEEEQYRAFCNAVQAAPKSGEVWCEGARLHMNPLSTNRFDLNTAERCLQFAIHFTPQYGDSFIELLRLKRLLLSNGRDFNGTIRQTEKRIHQLLQHCIEYEPTYGSLWHFCQLHPCDPVPQILHSADTLIATELTQFASIYQQAIIRNAHSQGKRCGGGGGGPLKHIDDPSGEVPFCGTELDFEEEEEETDMDDMSYATKEEVDADADDAVPCFQTFAMGLSTFAFLYSHASSSRGCLDDHFVHNDADKNHGDDDAGSTDDDHENVPHPSMLRRKLIFGCDSVSA